MYLKGSIAQDDCAWRGGRKNAGAAGIDRMKQQGLIFLEDFIKKPLELLLFSC